MWYLFNSVGVSIILNYTNKPRTWCYFYSEWPEGNFYTNYYFFMSLWTYNEGVCKFYFISLHLSWSLFHVYYLYTRSKKFHDIFQGLSRKKLKGKLWQCTNNHVHNILLDKTEIIHRLNVLWLKCRQKLQKFLLWRMCLCLLSMTFNSPSPCWSVPT